jgi:hypothetical protein
MPDQVGAPRWVRCLPLSALRPCQRLNPPTVGSPSGPVPAPTGSVGLRLDRGMMGPQGATP